MATTAVACISTKSFFAGHADGVVRAFGLVSGALERTFQAPNFRPDPSVSGGAAVTAIALYGDVSHDQVLAVGHADGTINNFSVRSGRYLTSFTSASGLTQLLSLRRFSSLAAVHAGQNSMTLWDLGSDRRCVLFHAPLLLLFLVTLRLLWCYDWFRCSCNRPHNHQLASLFNLLLCFAFMCAAWCWTLARSSPVSTGAAAR